MCQYSAIDGVPQTWHLVHLGSRAVGGASLVIAEATAVSAIGRISPSDTGIYNDEQMKAWQPIAAFIKDQKCIPGIQLAHAGRKASCSEPWAGDDWLTSTQGGWPTVGPSPLPFDSEAPPPEELSEEKILEIVTQFREAARRALKAGFQVVEIHMAHGYLLHEFLSPISNSRQDGFGGSLENRMRFPLMVSKAVREIWPAELPVFVRLSATDWTDGGWDLPQSIALSQKLKLQGIDLIDCSSGGNVPTAKIPAGPGYQVPFSEAVRRESGIATGAVGIITEPRQAESIIQEGRADAVLIARELLRDPYFPLRAAKVLGVDIPWPQQYERAKR